MFPLTVTVSAPLEPVQPAKSTCTESGIGSPSEFAGEAGVRVGVQAGIAPTAAGAARWASRPLPDALKLMPSGSAATSFATTSPTACACDWLSTGVAEGDWGSGQAAKTRAGGG